MSGTFTATDAAGNAATGSFVCATAPGRRRPRRPVDTGGGEVVPDSEAPGG